MVQPVVAAERHRVAARGAVHFKQLPPKYGFCDIPAARARGFLLPDGIRSSRERNAGRPAAIYAKWCRTQTRHLNFFFFFLLLVLSDTDTLYTCCIFFLIIWSGTILITTSREKPERLRACWARRTHWQAPANSVAQWKCLLEAKLASVEMFTLR